MKHLLALLILFSATTLSHAAGELDLTFVPKLYANGEVQFAAKAPGGKTIIAGNFDWVNGVPADWIACLNSDGSVDTGFNPQRPAMMERVTLVVPQADGKLLLGYSYALKMYAMASPAAAKTVSDTTTPTMPLMDGFGAKLRRLNADGSLDTTFTEVSFAMNPMGFSLEDTLRVAIPQADGTILVAGSFAGVNGVVRPWIARLKSDGTLDAEFKTTLNGFVNDGVLCGDGCVVLGGQFSLINKAKLAFGMVRLKADGTRDETFKPTGKLRGRIVDVAAGTGGNFLLATVTNGPRGKGGVVLGPDTANIERVGPKGASVKVLADRIAGTPAGLGLIGNGQALMVTTAGTAYNLAVAAAASSTTPVKLMAPGTSVFLDLANEKVKPKVVSLGFRPNGFYRSNGSVIGYGLSGPGVGATTSFRGFDFITPPATTASAAQTASAAPAPAPLPWVGGSAYVSKIAVVPATSKLIAVGSFTFGLTAEGKVVARDGLVRLAADGSVDEAFAPAMACDVQHLLADEGGGATLIGTPRNSTTAKLMRLKADGTLDTAFTTQEITSANCLVRTPNGNLLVGRSVYDTSGVTPATTNTTAPAPASRSKKPSVVDVVTHAGSLVVNHTSGSSTGTGTITLSNVGTLAGNGIVKTGAITLFNNTPLSTSATLVQNTSGALGLSLSSGLVLNVIDWGSSMSSTWTTAFLSSPPSPTAALWEFDKNGINLNGHFITLSVYGNTTAFDLTGTTNAKTYSVTRIFVEADGSMVLTGDFSAVNGVKRAGIARRKADRTFDNDAFTSAPPSGFNQVLARGTGGYLVTAPQLQYGEGPVVMPLATTPVIEPGNEVVYVDGSTHQPVNQTTLTAAPPPDAAGSLMISMPIFLGNGGSTRSPFYGSLTDGTEDTTFTIADIVPSPAWSWRGQVYGVPNILVHPAGGWVAMTRGLKDKTTDKAVAFVRVNADGSIDHTVVDASFSSASVDGGMFFWWGPQVAADFVQDMVVLGDGSVIVAGSFWSVNGEARSGLAKFSF